jgi:hypothetical protein
MLRIRDPRSGKKSSRIPDPWGKKSRIRIRNTEAGIVVYLRYEHVLKIDPYQRNPEKWTFLPRKLRVDFKA